VRLVNKTGQHFASDAFGGVEAPPDGVIEVEDGYCNAMLSGNGSRIPSIAERRLPGFVPEDAALRETWGSHLRISPVAVPSQAQRVARLAAEEALPPAVAAQVASGEIALPRRKKRGE
jgi:hypothetical protein